MANDVKYKISLIDLFTPAIRGAIGETNKLNTAVGSLGGKIKGMFAGLAVGFAVTDIVQATASYESLVSGIKASSVTTQEGEKNISFLNNEIDRLGLNLESTFKGFKTFQGAVKGTSMDGDVARKMFTGVSEAVTAMSLSGDDAEGIFLAMGQVISKGSVQAEELKGQIGERLPGAFQKAAASMNMTTAALGKAMQKGEIMAEDLLPKLSEALGIEFHDAALLASMGLQANINRMNNSLLRLKVILGTTLLPIILAVMEGVMKLSELIKSSIQFVKDHATAFGALAGALGGLLAVTIAYYAWQKLVWITSSVQAIYNLWKFGAALEGITMAQYALNAATVIWDALSGNWAAIAAAGAVILAGGIWGAYEAQKALNGEMGKGQEALTPIETEWKRNPMSVKPKGTKGLSETEKTKGGKKGTEVTASEATKTNNFNITIQKLVETLEFNTSNITESGTVIKNEVTKQLITAINDFQIMATK